MIFKEQEHSARPTDVDKARLWDMEEDQYSTTGELAKKLDIRAMSISHAMHHINVTFKLNHWVPYELI